jgi:hypothetical protein
MNRTPAFRSASAGFVYATLTLLMLHILLA